MTYWHVTWHKHKKNCTDIHSDISFPRSSVRRCIALLSNLQTLLPFAENGSGRGTLLTPIPTGLVVLSCVHALHELRVRGSQDFKQESIGKCMVLLNQCHIPSVSASFLSLNPIMTGHFCWPKNHCITMGRPYGYPNMEKPMMFPKLG